MGIYSFGSPQLKRLIVRGYFQCNASALIGDASGDAVGLGGDAAIASAFEPDVTASDAKVATALQGIVDALQAHGILGAS